MGILGRGPVDRTDRRVFPCVARSGSLVFSAPSSALTVTGLALEGFRSSPCLADPERPTWADPAHFISPSELCTHRPGRAPDTLAGSSETTSSRGIRPAVRSETTACAATPYGRRPPLHRRWIAQARSRVCHRASTPTCIAACFGFEEPSSKSCSVLVVSHHLDGFLRSGVEGLFHPSADPGVRCVSHDPAARRQAVAVPAASNRTPRRLTSFAAARCHHRRCLPAVSTAPRRCSARRGRIVPRRPCGGVVRFVSSWALVPFKVPGAPLPASRRETDPSPGSTVTLP
jgi:hypothetical protein